MLISGLWYLERPARASQMRLYGVTRVLMEGGSPNPKIYKRLKIYTDKLFMEQL